MLTVKYRNTVKRKKKGKEKPTKQQEETLYVYGGSWDRDQSENHL